ncbi:MAG TPA: fatty acid desaturase [Pirellulales bacterium]|nr:fatty acid desaturase [Pirellulales bacterium]
MSSSPTQVGASPAGLTASSVSMPIIASRSTAEARADHNSSALKSPPSAADETNGERPESAVGAFSFREARRILGDLFVHRAAIYWADMLLTLTVGYGFAMVYFRAAAFSPLQIASFLIAGFALFRVGSFVHEITHLRQGELLAFRIGWNLLAGIPMLMPSFFYENHIDHHNSHRYGTVRDGEYLPLGNGSRWKLLWFWLQVPLLPIYIYVRLLVVAPLSFLYPPLRKWAIEHMSSFVINFRHRLDVPPWAPRKAWAALEMACCLRASVVLIAIASGFHPWTYGLQLYLLALMTLALNYIRNMVAHHYRNAGEEMTYLEQLEDSVNITGGPIFTELFFPLGLRFHALHHLFPSLPYHNLGVAHRRLMAELPADSPYRRTVYPSFWAVMHELWTDRGREKSRVEPSAEAA